MTAHLDLRAHAKLNLQLRVTGTRADGSHEVDTVLQSISLHDAVQLEVAERTSLELIAGEAPTGPDNLVLKAVAALERASGRTLPVRVRLLKRIPAGAGLAGGSSDAAVTLRAVSLLYGLDLDLLPLAAELGADVPFFLQGGTARGRGRGDVLTPMAANSGAYALAWPGFAVSTAAVYRAWDEVGGEDPNHLERAACKVEPRLAGFRQSLGPGWQLTGSGSAYFKVCISHPEAAAAIAPLSCWTSVAAPVGPW